MTGTNNRTSNFLNTRPPAGLWSHILRKAVNMTTMTLQEGKRETATTSDGPRSTQFPVEITPEMAERWLAPEVNRNNRRINKKRAENIARDIKNGNFSTTNQSIGFSADGSLADGQHRLYAIHLANTPVEMFVVHGLAPEAMAHIDNGLKRSVTELLELGYGERYSRAGIGVARRMIVGPAHPTPQFTSDELREICGAHADAIEFSLSHIRSKTGNAGISNAEVRSVVARAWYTVDREKLGRFCSVLCGGTIEDTTEQTAIRLREHLLYANSKRSRGACYRKTQMALSAFMAGSPIKKITVARSENFPIPGDKEWKS